MLYNEQIEALISAALADGVLTEKEKQVLFKKAEKQGIDLDEFEMVLDARLVELQKAEKEKAEKAAPKSNKLGNIRTCPNCGTVIGSFQMTCPECGFEFVGVGSNAFVEKFSQKLQNITNNALSKSRGAVTAESRFVKNYPLPMAKEDCIEMLNFILPKTYLSGSNGATRAWRSKYNAILAKLEVEGRKNPQIQEIVKSYKKQAKMSLFGKCIIWYKSWSSLFKVVFWIILFYVIVFVFCFGLLGYVFHSVML